MTIGSHRRLNRYMSTSRRRCQKCRPAVHLPPALESVLRERTGRWNRYEGSDELGLIEVDPADFAERLTAVEHAADRLSAYLREHRSTLKSVAPLLLAGSEKAPQLTLESDLSFRVRSIDARKRSSMDRASIAEVVELWAAADLYDRLEAALRRAAGLSTRPTGAVIAGLGVAGDRGARV